MDTILERIKVDPLARIHKGPMAPRPTAAERVLLKPIGVIGGDSILRREPTAASGVSLIQSGSSTKAVSALDSKNYLTATLRDPNMNVPPPEDPEFYRARDKFHATKVGDVELKLRKLWPKPVVVQPDRIQTADMLMNADEILPKDPTADIMLMTFNQKYGVFDDNGVPSSLPEPPNSDLLPTNKQNLTKIQREYTDTFDGANKFGFDPEKDSIQSLDKMLSDMWMKRWEYFSSEQSAAEAREKARAEPSPDAVPTFTIDPLFPEKQVNEDQTGESLLGNVYIMPRDPDVSRLEPIPSIENRDKFKPQTSFYGPNVNAKAVDLAYAASPAQPEFIKPEYNGPFVPEKAVIRLIPETPAVDDPNEKITPLLKGGDFDALNAKPAILLPKLPSTLKKIWKRSVEAKGMPQLPPK